MLEIRDGGDEEGQRDAVFMAERNVLPDHLEVVVRMWADEEDGVVLTDRGRLVCEVRLVLSVLGASLLRHGHCRF